MRSAPEYRLRRWGISFLVVVLLVATSITWVDRPLAILVHDTLKSLSLLDFRNRISHFAGERQSVGLLESTALAIVAFFGFRKLSAKPMSKLEAALFLSSLSLIIASAAKVQLKATFGRTWPETWTHNNPSLIENGVYGFNPLHGGPEFQSFPSGHMSAACAVISVLWIYYPRLRALYVILLSAAAIILVGMNFHFLGDVIAGGFLGGSVGWTATTLWNTDPINGRHATDVD